jgi:hypothetical protein
MSDIDIAAGSRWHSEVSSVLDSTDVGLICVTPENLHSQWLHFEAGALSKALDQSRVCPIGLDLTPGQISGPLSHFQTVALDSAGMFKVLSSLNQLLGNSALPPQELDASFKVWWPSLAEDVARIPGASSPEPVRKVEDQLEELLQIGREQLRRENLRLEASRLKDDKIDDMLAMMERATSALRPLMSQAVNSQAAANGTIAALKNAFASSGIAEAAVPLLEALESTSLPAPLELDVSALTAMAAQVKRAQAESKELTDQLLSRPNDPPKSPGA